MTKTYRLPISVSGSDPTMSMHAWPLLKWNYWLVKLQRGMARFWYIAGSTPIFNISTLISWLHLYLPSQWWKTTLLLIRYRMCHQYVGEDGHPFEPMPTNYLMTKLLFTHLPQCKHLMRTHTNLYKFHTRFSVDKKTCWGLVEIQGVHFVYSKANWKLVDNREVRLSPTKPVGGL